MRLLTETAAPAGREPFAAYVAHELRAPIALQRALVEVTLADPEADVADLRAMGEGVLASCERQQRLIEALLDLVRAGRGLARREPVDLASIATAALGADHPGELASVVTLESAWTSGDPELLERLAANLVTNAIRHNVAGGWIEIATRAGAGRAVLSVANTGPPIPACEVQRLFEPFRRLAPEPMNADVGFGIGLAVVQAIADAHDAAVAGRARAGGGLEIHLTFPALD